MNLILQKYFYKATRVTNMFYVQKLASKALEEIRIKTIISICDSENI